MHKRRAHHGRTNLAHHQAMGRCDLGDPRDE
jgi:hypothetical protein